MAWFNYTFLVYFSGRLLHDTCLALAPVRVFEVKRNILQDFVKSYHQYLLKIEWLMVID